MEQASNLGSNDRAGGANGKTWINSILRFVGFWQGPVKLEQMDLSMKRVIDRSPCVILVARLKEAICQAEDGVEVGEDDQGSFGLQKSTGDFQKLA